MSKYFKTMTAMALVLIMVLSLSGCSSDQESGIYSLSEIDDGYYIKSGDDFYPLIEDSNKKDSKSSKTVSSTISSESISVIWISEDRDKIPVCGKDCELIFSSESSVPDVIPLYHLTDYGISLGMKLARTYDENVLCFTSDKQNRFCTDSDAESVFNSKSIDDFTSVKIISIGGSSVGNDMLTEVYTIKNLTDGDDYNITYYIGTKSKSVTVTADTHVFSATKGGIKSLSNISYTKQGYVILNFPNELSEGYYYVDGGGVFYYAPDRAGGFWGN